VSAAARMLIVAAVAFTVAGDYALKRYGDDRRTSHLVACLVLWEVCALLWVLAYRHRLPLGRATAFGMAIVVVFNVVVGATIFRERMSAAQWIGGAFALVGAVLLA
jgi:multidrug transporter EmrE-like cation transporter